MQKENTAPIESHQYVGPYRLDKTLGKGQTGKVSLNHFSSFIYSLHFDIVISIVLMILGLFVVSKQSSRKAILSLFFFFVRYRLHWKIMLYKSIVFGIHVLMSFLLYERHTFPFLCRRLSKVGRKKIKQR